MLEVFAYSFMRRAFIVGNLVAIICPLIGVFLTLKRLSLIGHTLSHISLAGVALGMLLGIYPIYTALIVAITASLGIEKLRQDYKDYEELSLAIILATGLGVAIILISLISNSSGIFSYLFGSISLITMKDIFIIIPLAILIIGIIFYFYYGFFFLAFNEAEARLAGVPVKRLNTIFLIIVAITVAISMRIIGGLLVSSLITLPVATSLQLAKSFKATIRNSIIFSILAVNVGLIIAFYQDLAPGGTIILASVVCLITVIIYKWVRGLICRWQEVKV
ncbi:MULTISPECIES: metal ABC transporter permease [unclassified Candidatus Frackibacter]|uniref:metal ABC transporter permease n=1 Tax=unclassified Candidatus Frackibacter TaxID=2648818 RepID=UPI0008882CDE|nr:MULTISPECIES: metal ABC transporter permease [unclassified Candidatus Frackibacter]SDC18530.1 zinc transport system permease protein [Candidatus Frackibacter sp. WG11]SEM43746.1 zinc transport system permease protein [Candidatus Frackibacter sp. WG12]SFL46142.1 zinc transport system permease protein [Candidatus Frackibacter sp. WG13]